MPLADLQALFQGSTQNASQAKGLTAAYQVLKGGVPTIDGYTFLINENNNTNFGAGASGPTFNDENIYINVMNALYQGDMEAKATFDAIVAGGATLQDKLVAVYNNFIPAAQQTDAGRAYFTSQADFYTTRAAELGIAGPNGASLVAAAALIKIAVDNDIPGIGDNINDLLAAVQDGSAQIPQSGTDFTPLETADGTNYDSDDASSSAGQTFTLTTGIDNVQGSGQDDKIIAGVEAGGGAGTTLNPGDLIDGKGGTDALNLFSNANIANFTAASISGVENVFAQFSADTGALDVSGNGDVKQAWFSNSNVAINAGKGTATVSLTTAQTGGITGTTTIGTGAANADLVFDFKSVAAANDSATIALKNASNPAGAGVESTVSVAGVETLTLMAEGKNSIGTLVDSSLESLIVNGDGSLSLKNTSGSLTSVDATANKGGVTLDLSGAGGGKDMTLKGGSGADEIIVATAAFNDKDKADLGAGVDTLTFTGGAATFNSALTAKDISGVTNVEVLKTIGATLTVDGDFVSQNIFAVKGAGDINAKNLDDNATVKFLDGAHGGSKAGLVLGASTLNVELSGTKSTVSNTTLTATGTSTINVMSTDLPETATGNVLNLTAADNQKVMLTGSGDLTATFSALTGTTGFKVDGSAMSGKLDLTGTNAADIIIGGSGKDTLAGEALTASAAVAEVSSWDFSANFDIGDKVKFAFEGNDYTYTVTAGNETAAAVWIQLLAAIGSVSGNPLTTDLAANNVTQTFVGTDLTLTATVAGPAGAFTDTFVITEKQDTQTIDLSSVDNADKVGLTINGNTYTLTATAGEVIDLSNAANTTAVANINAVTGGTLTSVSTGATDVDLVLTGPTSGAALNFVVTGTTGADMVLDSLSRDNPGGTEDDAITVDAANSVAAQPAGAFELPAALSADTLTGNGGADNFVIATASGNTAADAEVITDFLSGTDKIDFSNTNNGTASPAGTSTNYAEGATPVASFAAAVVAANAQLGGTVIYSAQQVGADTYLFYDGNGNGDVTNNTFDYVVKLQGVALDGIAFADIA